MTAQAVFDRILGCTLDGLKEIVGGYWLDAMPLIGPAKKGKEERDFRNGSLLCQLMAVVDERSVYSSILNPTSYHPIFSRDNVAISLMALEQILLCEKIQKTQVSKVATTLTMERILDGDKTTTLRILALIKFALEWREGSFGSASAFFNPTAAAKQRTIIKKEATEAEKKVMRWLTRDLGLVEVGRTFAQALAKVRAGPLFARIAEKVSNKKVFGQIDQHPETKEAEDANVKKVFKNLERMPEISKLPLCVAAQAHCGRHAVLAPLSRRPAEVSRHQEKIGQGNSGQRTQASIQDRRLHQIREEAEAGEEGTRQ